MNHKLFWILVFTLSRAAFAHGQTASNAAQVVFGNGTPNYLPVWTVHNTIGNSILFQSANSLGLGTTSPQGTLDVESGQFNGLFVVTSSSAQYARAISATASAQGGQSYGVVASTNSTNFGAGVVGLASANSGTSFGMFGAASSPFGIGIFGYASATSGVPVGVSGQIDSPGGIAARFNSTSGSGWLIQGNSGSNFTTVFYVDASGNGYYGGNLYVAGNLSKGSGSFKIDDPLDPANKTLSHSFVGSPDMMNIYNGVVQLDAKGRAWVDLPKYFDALNSDFRYQLTAIGAPGPGLYIAQEVAGNRFKIEGGKPGAKVSWQVTGVRQDAYANAHRIPVEEDKAASERGYYLHPDVFGQPQSKGIEAANNTQPSTIDAAKLAAISNAGPKTAQ